MLLRLLGERTRMSTVHSGHSNRGFATHDEFGNYRIRACCRRPAMLSVSPLRVGTIRHPQQELVKKSSAYRAPLFAALLAPTRLRWSHQQRFRMWRPHHTWLLPTRTSGHNFHRPRPLDDSVCGTTQHSSRPGHTGRSCHSQTVL
jgi:hypothetical protein